MRQVDALQTTIHLPPSLIWNTVYNFGEVLKKHQWGTSRISGNLVIASLSTNFSQKQSRLELTAHLFRVSRKSWEAIAQSCFV